MKSMLDAITLATLEKIFKERAEQQISSMSKMLYTNCLIGRFRELPLNEKNAQGFEMFLVEIKNYSQWEKRFIELHRAKLITITDTMILFHNHWGTFIDKNIFNEKNNTEYTEQKKFAEEFYDEMLQSKSITDLVSMRNKWSKNQLIKALDLFMIEQMATENKYDTLS